MILADPEEVKLVKKECFNRWYGITPYYAALTVCRIPLQVLFNFIFLALCYSLPGLPLEWWRFLLFAFVGMVVSLVAEGMGLAIGATFSVTVSSRTLLWASLVLTYPSSSCRMAVPLVPSS